MLFRSNLREEIDKWGGLNCDIIGIESIQSSDRIYLDIYNKVKNNKSFIVCDESLKIKNGDAKRTKRLLYLSSLCEYRLILNGTPLSRNLLDLWSQMQFLSPLILKMNFTEFKNTFCEYVEIKHKGRVFKEFIKRYHNVEFLYKSIEPFIFESKLSLSIGQQHINIEYKLSEEEKAGHNLLKEKYLNDEYLMKHNNNVFLKITQKMQHNYSLSSEKFKIVDEIIKDNDKSKVLIYAKYIETQSVLCEYYKDVRIMSLQKHSFGLNLQDYNIIIFWDKTWDYAIREQIERRIYRTGQKSECVYYDLTGDVGLEKLINENIEKKRDLLEMFKKISINKLKEVL